MKNNSLLNASAMAAVVITVRSLARSTPALALAGSLFLAGVSSSATSAQLLSKSPIPATVPFELRSGFLIVIYGQIGAIGGLRFILDTGTTHSVIDAKLAKKLPRRPQLTSVTHSFDKTIPVKTTEISDVVIGPLHVRSLPVLVMKLTEVSSYAQDIDGLIGLDFLSQSAAFTIDYQAKTVSLDLAEGYSPGPIGCLLMQVNIQGLPVDLVVDTGLPDIVLYRNRLRARLPGLRVSGVVERVKRGSLRLTSARLSDVSFNGTTADRDVYFIDEDPQGTIPGVDGFIGPIELKAQRLEFDFVRGQLRTFTELQ